MLTQIELENFKCFKDRTAFQLGKLTLLTGVNGGGKSTLLQSLLLMKQSIEHNDRTAQIVLNGSCVKLGTFKDIKNSSLSRSEPIIFKYVYETDICFDTELGFKVIGHAEYSFKENLEDEMLATIDKIIFSYKSNTMMNIEREEYLTELEAVYKKSEKVNKLFDIDTLDYHAVIGGLSAFAKYEKKEITKSCSIINLLPFPADEDYFTPSKHERWKFDVYSLNKSLYFHKIHYISADRLPPQDTYFKYTFNKFPSVGARGEFTVNLLYKKKDELVNDKLCLGKDAKTLYTQTEEWMNVIFNGAKVEIPSSDSNILELLLNTSKSKDRFKPANVGFGYHCVLPIVVSGLIAKEGEKLIVENPEAHLHPRAQSQLAKFLAKVSSCGVQVFIESHSDHILNALRIAVLDEIITSDDLSVLYFQSDPQQPVVKIPVQPNGAIEEWPEGFFDQMDKDFSRLFGM